MVKNTTKATPAKADKAAPKRKMLTPAERVAKLERELAEARDKAQGKDRKEQARLEEKVKTLREKAGKINDEIAAVEAELNVVTARLSVHPVTDGVGEPSEG